MTMICNWLRKDGECSVFCKFRHGGTLFLVRSIAAIFRATSFYCFDFYLKARRGRDLRKLCLLSARKS